MCRPRDCVQSANKDGIAAWNKSRQRGACRAPQSETRNRTGGATANKLRAACSEPGKQGLVAGGINAVHLKRLRERRRRPAAARARGSPLPGRRRRTRRTASLSRRGRSTACAGSSGRSAPRTKLRQAGPGTNERSKKYWLCGWFSAASCWVRFQCPQSTLFFECLHYRPTQTSSGNDDNIQLRFGPPRRDPFFDHSRPVLREPLVYFLI